MLRSHSNFRALIALALSGLFAASGSLFSSHLFQENADLVLRPVSPVEACQPGNGHGLVSDHSLQVKPAHVCVVCKIFSGALHVGSGPTVPLVSPSSGFAFSQGQKLHFAGFTRLSRSPPTRS
jgi:hypothetical protein